MPLLATTLNESLQQPVFGLPSQLSWTIPGIAYAPFRLLRLYILPHPGMPFSILSTFQSCIYSLKLSSGTSLAVQW